MKNTADEHPSYYLHRTRQNPARLVFRRKGHRVVHMLRPIAPWTKEQRERYFMKFHMNEIFGKFGATESSPKPGEGMHVAEFAKRATYNGYTMTPRREVYYDVMSSYPASMLKDSPR